MRVEVDPDLCQGHGECVALAPEVFALERRAEHVHILLDVVPPALRGPVADAVKYCPAMALRLLDQDKT